MLIQFYHPSDYRAVKSVMICSIHVSLSFYDSVHPHAIGFTNYKAETDHTAYLMKVKLVLQ